MKVRIGLAAVIAFFALAAARPIDRPIDNGDFSEGLRGWTPFIKNPVNHITVGSDPAAGIRHAARILVNPATTKPPTWHVNLVWKNQGLERLKPGRPYTLRFRARASSPRRLVLALAQEYRPYRNLGLRGSVQLDRTWRTYAVSFFTDTMIAEREPDNSGPWLSFFADSLAGETWLTAIRIEPASFTAHRAGSPGLLSTFRFEDAWQGLGSMRIPTRQSPDSGVRLTIPPNSMRFIERELPLALPDEDWKLKLKVWVDAPEHLGRLSLFARSGEGIDYAVASVSGLERGWNHITLTRRQFVRHWFSHVRWDSVQTLALRIETNANGPLMIEPAALTIVSGGAPRPQVTRITVEPTASDVMIVCETETPVRATLAWGATTRYGFSRRSSALGTRHTFTLRGLAPNRRYHAKVRFTSEAGVPGASGDIGFSTVVTKPRTLAVTTRDSSAAGANVRAMAHEHFDLGLFGVQSTEDVLTTGRTAFNSVQSYQLSSVAHNSAADARRYLDAAASQDLRVLVGFDLASVKAGDLDYVTSRVRALRDHPALQGWYAYDEPEGAAVDPGILAAVRRAIRAEDPAHPVTIATSWLGDDYPFRGGFDVAILDRFPVPYAGPASIVPALERARRSGERWQFVFQAYATDVDHRWPGGAPGRYPTRDEMRAMAFLALNHGAQGLWAFSFDYIHHTPGSEWKWVELTELMRELRGLEAVWASSDAPRLRVTSASDDALDTGVRRYQGVHYLTVVNGSARTVKGSVALSDLPETPEIARFDADAPFEPAGELSGSRLTATWQPHAVHVYAITRGRR